MRCKFFYLIDLVCLIFDIGNWDFLELLVLYSRGFTSVKNGGLIGICFS